MKRVMATIVLAALVSSEGASAASIEEPLHRLRTLVPEMLVARPDASREYVDVVARIIEEAKSDPVAKGRLTEEIASLATKTQVTAVDGWTSLTTGQKEDFVYAILLLDTLTRVDRQAFLVLSRDILGDARASSLYKDNVFGTVLSMRASVRAVDPNALPVYDKGVLSLGLELLDKEDGLRFTFGTRGDLRQFVAHLVGYSAGGVTLPPINREKGLALARRFIRDDRFHFFEKQWYMGQVAAFDPQVRQEYARRLKAYVGAAKMSRRLRVRYAEKLVEMGELEADELRDLKNTPEDPNTFGYESGHTEDL